MSLHNGTGVMQPQGRDISVVIPLYNKKAHISRAIQSILNQDALPCEIVVVDDGSNDGGGMEASSLGSSLVRVVRQDNQGTSAARNRGVAESRAPFVAFLDADDEWLPCHLSNLLKLIEEFPRAGLFASAYENQEPDGRVVPRRFWGIPPGPWRGLVTNYFLSCTYGDPLAWTSALCVRRELLHSVGGFKVGARIGQDLDMWGRLALVTDIAFSNMVSARYHRGASNRAINVSAPDSQPPFVDTALELKRCGMVRADQLPSLDLYLDKLRVDSASRNIRNGFFREASRLLDTCQTDFRIKRRLLLRLYCVLPALYRSVQMVKRGMSKLTGIYRP